MSVTQLDDLTPPRALAAAVALASRTTVDPRLRPCCVSARLLLVELYGVERVDRAPVQWWHLDVKGGAPGAWSPIDAAQRAGLADAEPADWSPGQPPPILAPGVYLCQVWRGVPLADGVSGHTVVLAVTRRRSWVLDSVASRPYSARPEAFGPLLGEVGQGGGVRIVRLAPA